MEVTLKTLSIRITNEQHAKLSKRARKENRSMNAHIQYLIEHEGDTVRIPVVNWDEYQAYLKSPLDPRD